MAHEYDITYAYDLLGRLTQAHDSNTHVTNICYDALGRRASDQSTWRTRTMQYDAAGRRTRHDWGDGFFVTYDYQVTGEMIAIRENGGLALASFAYNDLGRCTSLTRGNGTVTGYAFDRVGQLAQLTHYRSSAGQIDQRYIYGHNPAGQIVSKVSSNDAWAFTGAYNIDRNYKTNGLNQYTASGSVAPTYDTRGNLTSAGGPTALRVRPGHRRAVGVVRGRGDDRSSLSARR